jgi:hypothetical protein
MQTMWNESATRASECTAYPNQSSISNNVTSIFQRYQLIYLDAPTTSSNKKKALSIPSKIPIRVDFDNPILCELARGGRALGPCSTTKVCTYMSVGERGASVR